MPDIMLDSKLEKYDNGCFSGNDVTQRIITNIYRP